MTSQRRVSIDLLAVGARLETSIPDVENPRVKLLAEGTRITEEFLARLRERRIQSVVLNEKDIAKLNAFVPQGRAVKVPPAPEYLISQSINEQTLALDERIEQSDLSLSDSNTKPFSSKTKKLENCRYEREMTHQWAEDAGLTIDIIEDVFDESLASNRGSVGALHVACHEILQRMVEDIDALVCMACSPFETNYPARHGFHLASLAMSIGSRMDLDEATLIDLGVGCMVHDIGMCAVGIGMFSNKTDLSIAQLKRLSDHPIKGAEVIGRFGEQLSIDSKMVAYQIHERCDGSGYPRGRLSGEIHPLAKIAMVADSMIGMMSTRPHRIAIQGYYAIVHLLEDLKQGKFDPRVVRALLELTSIHPLGTLVDLSNNKVGRVVRSNGKAFDKPTIEMWDSPERTGQPSIVNLQHENEIRILRAMPISKVA